MPYMTEVMIIIVSYLLGSIPFALIVGKLGYRVDVREHGSGNLGTTNTFRVLGKKAGTLVLLGDMGKGLVAALLPLLFGSDMSLLLAGIPAIIGHSYPIFAKFKGGKSVATSAGILLAAFPWFFFVVVGTFIVALLISKMVSLSSMAASAVGLVTVVTYSVITKDWLPLIVIVPLALFIIIKHRTNWQRIRAGTEPKVPLFQKKNKDVAERDLSSGFRSVFVVCDETISSDLPIVVDFRGLSRKRMKKVLDLPVLYFQFTLNLHPFAKMEEEAIFAEEAGLCR